MIKVSYMKPNQKGSLALLLEEAADYNRRGKTIKAIEIFQGILAEHGDDASVCESSNAHLGEIYLKMKKFKEAEGHLKKALDYYPINDQYHYLLGSVYFNVQEWAAAVNEFQSSVNERPQKIEYLRALGDAMLKSHDQFGLYHLHRAASFQPDNIDILNDLATAYLALSELGKAQEYAERAVKVDPINYFANKLLVEIKGRMERRSQKR